MVLSYSLWLTSVWASFGLTGIATGAVLYAIRAIIGGMSIYAVWMRTGIPTAVAALAWRRLEKFTHVTSWPVLFLPLGAVALFVARVGLTMDAWYAMYWLLVPVVYALLPRDMRTHTVVRSFVCSFNAHAVGSLIILFAGFEIPWVALIPLVLFERLVATVGIASVAYAYQALCRRVQRSIMLERY